MKEKMLGSKTINRKPAKPVDAVAQQDTHLVSRKHEKASAALEAELITLRLNQQELLIIF